MPKVSPIQSNFGTGEISPYLQGRVDMDRYKAALSTCLNQVPTVQGALTRRPGGYFHCEVKDQSKFTRLIPFKFSATDAYILEFGDGYIRFHTQYGQVLNSDGDPLEVETNFSEAELPEITYAQSADVLYLCHPSYRPMKLSRYAPMAWVFETINFAIEPFEFHTQIPAFDMSGVVGSNCTITAAEAGLGTVTAAVNNTGRYEITVNGGVIDPGWAQHTRLRIKNISGTVPFAGDWDVEFIGNNRFILLGSTYTTAYNYPTDTATAIRPIFRSTDVGRRIKLYKYTGTETHHFDLKITSVTDSLTVSATNMWGTTFSDQDGMTATLGLWYQGNGPSAVSFFEDRLFYTGTPTAPQRVDGSKTGDYENFNPYNDTDFEITASGAVSFRLNSTDVNNGKWLFSDEKGLLTGTLSSEWVVKSAGAQEGISPTSISAKQASANGSSDCYPVQVGKAILFVQKSGRKVQEFHYFYDVDGFRATDLTVLSEHITQSGIKQLAYQKDPNKIVWAIRNDGTLIGLTYDRDIDNVRAGWHRHSVGGDGFVESIACIPSPDGTRDDLWMIVKRTVDGTVKRYIEYMAPFFEDNQDQKEAFFVECGLTLENPDNDPLTTIAGLDHLEGETVSVVADGKVLSARVVTGGAISVSTTASLIHVGLHAPARGQLPRLDAGSADGTSIGKTRRTNKVGFMLHRSAALKFGSNFEDMTRMQFRTSNVPMNQAVPLFTGIVVENVSFDYDFENQIAWEMDQPLPFTIQAIFPQMTTQDR